MARREGIAHGFNSATGGNVSNPRSPFPFDNLAPHAVDALTFGKGIARSRLAKPRRVLLQPSTCADISHGHVSCSGVRHMKTPMGQLHPRAVVAALSFLMTLGLGC